MAAVIMGCPARNTVESETGKRDRPVVCSGLANQPFQTARYALLLSPKGRQIHGLLGGMQPRSSYYQDSSLPLLTFPELQFGQGILNDMRFLGVYRPACVRSKLNTV